MFGINSKEQADAKSRDINFLDTYAMSRWNCLLHYMVDSNASKGSEIEGISVDAVRIILHANLMNRNEQDGSVTLTSQGFQFLLMDTQSQVWHFMLQYLNTCEHRGLSLVECLSMLFQLSFSTLGRDYSSEGLSENMLTFLQHLREFGLVYQRTVSMIVIIQVLCHVKANIIFEIIPLTNKKKIYLLKKKSFQISEKNEDFSQLDLH